MGKIVGDAQSRVRTYKYCLMNVRIVLNKATVRRSRRESRKRLEVSKTAPSCSLSLAQVFFYYVISFDGMMEETLKHFADDLRSQNDHECDDFDQDDNKKTRTVRPNSRSHCR